MDHSDLDHIAKLEPRDGVLMALRSAWLRTTELRVDVAQVAAPYHQGFDVALFPGFLNCFVHMALQSGAGYRRKC